MVNILRQLEEFHLLRHSLLQGESLTFTPQHDPDALLWQSLLDQYPDNIPDLESSPTLPLPGSQPQIEVKTEDSHIWFEVALPNEYGNSHSSLSVWRRYLPLMIHVRGDSITRTKQETWQRIVTDSIAELQDDSQYPLYELICTHLLPQLHEYSGARGQNSKSDSPVPDTMDTNDQQLRYHALLTSHHLVSPTKRRNLQTWSCKFSISGFAKVGYPGVIYCEGSQEDVEEFVGSIKAMQWLALKVRFVEPVPESAVTALNDCNRSWAEFEKVGEVLQEMRRIGRESYVVEMGIGSAGVPSASKP